MADTFTENISGDKQINKRIGSISINTYNPNKYIVTTFWRTETIYPDGNSIVVDSETNKVVTENGELLSNEEITLESGKTINVQELLEAIPLIIRTWN